MSETQPKKTGAKGARPSLSSMRRPKPGGTAAATQPAAAAGAEEGDAKKKGGSDGRRAMTLRLPRDMAKSLKLAAINEERTATDIILQAISMYLKGAGGTKA